MKLEHSAASAANRNCNSKEEKTLKMANNTLNKPLKMDGVCFVIPPTMYTVIPKSIGNKISDKCLFKENEAMITNP